MTGPGDNPIRVLIVEDSDVVRMLLERIVGADPRLVVVGSVTNGVEALAAVERLAPDVISMDIRMPRMDGFETTRHIMTSRPTPIVVVSASVEAEDLKISMNALRAGALTVVEKPVGLSHADYEKLARTLCQQLVLMSSVKLVRQRGPLRAALDSSGRLPAAMPSPREPGPLSKRGYSVVGLVASTGGPNALATVLTGLGVGFRLPIVVVQHMTPSFHTGFVSWLGGTVPMPVRCAEAGMRMEAGCVYVAPSDRHLRVDGSLMRLTDEPPVAGQLPSGTVLLESLAASVGNRAIGVVFTGMGQDGADGLKRLHEVGAFTVAEHESTAVVYGMPAAAVALGAAREVLPLPRIAPLILQLSAMSMEVR